MTVDKIKIIINADDFGLHESCTQAIGEAFDRKLISSATMCANGSYFGEACQLSSNKRLEDKIGIHLNLTEGQPLTESIRHTSKFCNSDGLFHGKIDRLIPLTAQEKDLAAKELSAQIEKMRTAGFNITHADSHHHIHTGIFIVPTVVSVLKKFNIQKIRIHRNLGNISMPKKLIKIIYNTYLTMHGFIMVDRFGGFDDLAFLGAADGSIIEVMVHPDYNETGMLVDNTEYDVNAVSKSLQDRFNQLGSCHLYSYLELSK